jgi:hypothetical protein
MIDRRKFLAAVVVIPFAAKNSFASDNIGDIVQIRAMLHEVLSNHLYELNDATTRQSIINDIEVFMDSKFRGWTNHRTVLFDAEVDSNELRGFHAVQFRNGREVYFDLTVDDKGIHIKTIG